MLIFISLQKPFDEIIGWARDTGLIRKWEEEGIKEYRDILTEIQLEKEDFFTNRDHSLLTIWRQMRVYINILHCSYKYLQFTGCLPALSYGFWDCSYQQFCSLWKRGCLKNTIQAQMRAGGEPQNKTALHCNCQQERDQIMVNMSEKYKFSK